MGHQRKRHLKSPWLTLRFVGSSLGTCKNTEVKRAENRHQVTANWDSSKLKKRTHRQHHRLNALHWCLKDVYHIRGVCGRTQLVMKSDLITECDTLCRLTILGTLIIVTNHTSEQSR